MVAMIEQLFGSKTRVKLMHLFYSNPNRAFYVREITRKIDEQINSVRRELANLLKVGVISSENTDNKLYYEVNQSYEHHDAFKAIFADLSEVKGEQLDDQQQKFRDLGSTKLVYLMGAFVREDHPVDLFIVGDVNQTKLEKLVAELETELQSDLKYTVLSEKDYRYRKRIADRFIIQVTDAKKTVVVDELSESEKPGGEVDNNESTATDESDEDTSSDTDSSDQVVDTDNKEDK